MAHARSTSIAVYRDNRLVGFCSPKRAQARVRSHRAAWRDDVSIEMIRQDRRDEAERDAMASTRTGYDRASGSGQASLRELHNIPVSNARRLLGMGRNTGAYARRES